MNNLWTTYEWLMNDLWMTYEWLMNDLCIRPSKSKCFLFIILDIFKFPVFCPNHVHKKTRKIKGFDPALPNLWTTYEWLMNDLWMTYEHNQSPHPFPLLSFQHCSVSKISIKDCKAYCEPLQSALHFWTRLHTARNSPWESINPRGQAKWNQANFWTSE